MKSSEKNISLNDCRGCAAKIPQFVLNKSLINSNLNSFASSPEDSVEIYQNGQDIILQSVDGFPALVSDPWLNAKITTLHACSDLWACGAKLSSAQALISLPKVEREFQSYLFSQSLQGIKSTVEDHGGELLGGHTFEARSLVNKPYSLGIDISLTVQGILKNGAKPWLKSGMNIGDILMMSRPLGVGIYFAGQMQNINMLGSSSEVINNLVKSQQYLIDEIYLFQNQFKESLVNAATDITGYGFIGHLKEMVESSNLHRERNNLEPVKVLLDLFAFKSYPGIFDLIRKDDKSNNKKLFINKDFLLFKLDFVKNYGAAFNIFSGSRIFLSLISIFFSILLIYLIFRKNTLNLFDLYSYSFILGGTFGNGMDRIFKGFVIDFINLNIINFPVFNIADISINIGFTFLLYSIFKNKR